MPGSSPGPATDTERPMRTQRQDIAIEAAKNRTEEGVEILYQRGNFDAVTISKAIKFPQRKQAQFGQVTIDLTLQDWGIGIADLIVNGEASEPGRHDRITFVETGQVYSV